MKVFVAGATGRVGENLVSDLVSNGHFVYAAARGYQKIEETQNIKPVYLDFHDSVENIQEVLADSEAVIFVAGSRGKDLLQTDLNGAVKLMQATENKGIKRYIQLSSLFSMDQEKWSENPSLAAIMDYNVSKFYSDKWLIDNTNLDYTILQPGTLTEEAATGKVQLNDQVGGPNPIPDVASVLAAILENDNTVKKVISMHSGDVDINSAIKSI
ncbi:MULTISPECIES: NAD(P)H-binding protein [Lactobacillaceae]|uniref:NAD(P)H-binding protein n=1 Tax=Lactobacillaceae TaxID=33958 RepID=UPI000C1B7B0A|nr:MULTISPECIES: NAD(P)H-binding protein [Lactobacillaceae]